MPEDMAGNIRPYVYDDGQLVLPLTDKMCVVVSYSLYCSKDLRRFAETAIFHCKMSNDNCRDLRQHPAVRLRRWPAGSPPGDFIVQ